MRQNKLTITLQDVLAKKFRGHYDDIYTASFGQSLIFKGMRERYNLP
jgi:hypothetical protein